MEDNGRLNLLLEKYLSRTCTDAELAELEQCLVQQRQEEFSPVLEGLWQKMKEVAVQYPVDWEEMYAAVTGLQEQPAENTAPVRIMWKQWIAAASVVILVAVGAYLWITQNSKEHAQYNAVIAETQTDIQPGRDGAILKLADGREVLLDTVVSGAGLVANAGSATVSLNGNTLVYSALNPATADAGSTEAYNIMSTPHGRQFSLLLPDGTKVWLNAASSIKFPVAFSSTERKVELTGEGYFEVAEKNQPFIVNTRHQTIEVLGTHFNVNAYDDEDAERTTLLKGAVRVESSRSSVRPEILKPGQQAVLANSLTAGLFKSQSVDHPSQIKVQHISDLNKVVAWKNGLFDFSNASLKEVMRQLARWYDIRVEFEDKVPEIEFAGKVGRDVSLSKMLVFFKESGVNFRMENGNTLIIERK